MTITDRFDIKDLVNCKYNLENDYTDISNSSTFIESYILDNTQPYTVFVNYTYNASHHDKEIIQSCIDKWTSIILLKTTDNLYDLHIDVYFEADDPGILGAAKVDTVNSSGIPLSGSLYLNSTSWESQKNNIKEDGHSQAYYTVLHELGHIFGIGTLWNHLISNNFYIGLHGVREYKNLLHQPNLTGIPVEDDGGEGTAGGHFEEGSEFVLSDNNRYKDGHFHTGLDRELMTGWAETDNGTEPLSRISIAILQDIGFVVDYTKADPFFHDTSGHLNQGETLYIDDSPFILQKETNYFYYQFSQTSNYLKLSSSQSSTLSSIYIRYQNDDNFTSIPLRVFQNSYVSTYPTIEINETPVTLFISILPNKLLFDCILFFRN